MRDRHLVLFARAPRLGRVKRRLAQDIGPLAAWRFYRQNLANVSRALARGPWSCWLAITPDRSVAPGRATGVTAWRPIPQGRGDLGRRMARVLERLPVGPVVIVGSDIPGLGRCHVSEAFRALAERDVVVGPAPDGGYWLIGLRRRALARCLFQGVRWSSPHALADTLGNLGPGFTVPRLELLEDVDDSGSYERWCKRAETEMP